MMVEKISFVAIMLVLASIVFVLACFGWVYGCAWSRRTENFPT